MRLTSLRAQVFAVLMLFMIMFVTGEGAAAPGAAAGTHPLSSCCLIGISLRAILKSPSPVAALFCLL